MAEARRIEEGEGERRDQRDVRSRSQTTDRPERTKADHLHLSPGPLSSIRAAIKRTRSNSQSDLTRERRRPEITIVSAEPLACSSWFSGASVGFPPPLPPPPPPQSGWSTGIQPVSQPPPSYDQVIEEKTKEEHVVKPTAAPRRITCTTTSATQTDPVREVASNSRGAPRTEGKRPAGKNPKKPPRPSLPKPLDKEPDTESDLKVGTNTEAPTSTEGQSDFNTDLKQTDSTQTHTRSVIVHWDNPKEHPSAPSAETTPSSSDLGHSQRPVPLPRTKKVNILDTDEVKVQTLVKLSESCGETQSEEEEDFSSNKYLQELLEVFSADNESEEICGIANQSDGASQGENAEGDMSTNSQRNIRARIQAFESQVTVEEGNAEPAKPEPMPRKAVVKPPVLAKPSVALRPQFNLSTEEDNQNVSTANIPQSPTPAPRPQPPKKPVGHSIKDELETLHNKAAIPKRSRPSVLTRSECIYEDEPIPVLPPTPPVKPVKEPLKPNLNINNHNSSSMTRENMYVENPTNNNAVKPQLSADSNGGSFTRQSLTRRPTTIRVPSKADSFSEQFQDNPPPLPAQKPVGYLNSSVNHNQSRVPVLPIQHSFQSGPEPSLPPRRPSTNKHPPPRPPPAKIGPGRPPPPSLQGAGRSHSVSWNFSPKPHDHQPHRKGPILPPRPNPGHRLYNNYTLLLPHGIASFDYNGSNTGELSFQKNEVLLLLEEIDHNTFECQVGDAKGRVNKARMKVITPLSSVSHMPPPQSTGSGGSGLKVQAVHDFNPAGPGELGLRAGDVVTMVEQVDNQWYNGTCRGSTGFFPINHVKVLSNSPKPPRPQPAAVSGPRCVARFDFDSEQSDELSFSEGDMIQLSEYFGDDWARGKLGASSGIFPLNFVEIIEDLPSLPSQQYKKPTRIPLPGMVASPNTHPEVAKPAQASPSSVEWVVALYDFAGNSEDDLSFQTGNRILITQHVDAEWSCGRLNGREGIFPRAFVESSTGPQSADNQQSATDGSRARALFNFTSDCEEELSLQAGDIVTNLESVDEEWFMGELRGKRALVPKNYVKVL
ncbi:SH3 domain-containing protein 19 [Notolabrus celidotus]|uniref:SH3 domain-containing protein 19 n=1 Tax=Notolabrus celidotus TaxID=1203425 RepID=UPI0014905441|nr:SH3 domain-containing protein 19 [Notolabrus celidotus]